MVEVVVQEVVDLLLLMVELVVMVLHLVISLDLFLHLLFQEFQHGLLL